jgi:hypothetical protein
VPKTVSIQELPKGKAVPPQEWKAVVGKLPAGSVPKANKAAPVAVAALVSKNGKGGSNAAAVARRPLVSRN